MFKNLFKKKSEIEILTEQYNNLLKEAHRLSLINRTKSDEMTAQANAIGDQIESLKNNTK